MLSTGRNSEWLNTDELRRQIGKLDFDFDWSIRLVDMVGEWTSKTNWKYYPIPNQAVVSRNRSLAYEESTGQLTLEVLADFLPETTVLETYRRIEIDRVFPGSPPGQWPYFTGIIDNIVTNWRQEGGAIVKTYSIEAFGVLQLCKSKWINSLRFYPISTSYSGVLVGMTPTRRYTDTNDVGLGATEYIPSYFTGDVVNTIRIDDSSNFSSPYTRGDSTNGYTISTTPLPANPAQITWGSAVNPPPTVYIELLVPERFGVPAAIDDAAIRFIVLPYGRNADDLYHTKVAANGYDSGNKKITVIDPTPYTSTAGFLNEAQGEWITVTQITTGEEITRKLANPGVDANGVITHTSTAISFTDGKNPVEGDLVRLSTTEVYPVWLDGIKNPAAATTFWKNSVYSNAHKRGAFKMLTQQGLAITNLPYNFDGGNNDSVFVKDISYVNPTNTNNYVENFIRELFIGTTSITGFTGYKIYAAGDVTATWTGAFMKNLKKERMMLLDIVKEIEDLYLPPNSKVRDHPKGTITIEQYKQKTTADWILAGTISLREEADPEPVTKVYVFAKHDEQSAIGADIRMDQENRASWWYSSSSSNAVNPNRAIDGTKSLPVTRSGGATNIQYTFRIPAPTPPESFPHIKELRVSGRGFLTLKFVADPNGANETRYLQDYINTPLGITDSTNSGTATVTIPGIELIGFLSTTKDTDLTIVMEQDDTPGTPVEPLISEIEIIVNDISGWSASLTDDDSADGYGAAPSGWIPTDTSKYGSIWWQANPTKKESYRFAPTDYLKRVLIPYDNTATSPPAKSRSKQEHRTAYIELIGISQQDCRTSAEAYLDEYVRSSRKYHVEAPLFDAAEIGDTVTVLAPPGHKFSDGSTEKNLMLLAVSDGGSTQDNMASYTFADYS